nr:MAG: putative capsid protein [Lestijarvi alphachrysovirus]
MDLRKHFSSNRFTKMSEIMGEGIIANGSVGGSGLPVVDIGPSNLVNKTPKKRDITNQYDDNRLATMCDEILDNLGEVDNGKGPKIGELYQMIRSGGTNFRTAEDRVTIEQISQDIEKEGVCRRSEYYESIHNLGAHFFSVKPSKLQCFDSLIYKVDYTIFSALGESECKGMGSAQYSMETSVEILRAVENNVSRKKAKWTDWSCAQQRYFNSKCQDVMSETSIKVEDLLTAMQLPRENSSLSNVDMVKLREYLHMGPTGCLVVRFMVLYLILLRMWHANEEEITISIEKQKTHMEDFTTKGISACLNTVTDDTVVNVVNMSKTEQLIMARSVFGYSFGDFDINGFDFHMGGFDVPTEVRPKGRVILLGGDKKLPLTAKVTREDIYNTMVKYAMRMQSCDEMELGFNLAANIIFSDGLPNFSIPRPQGYVDIIATALSKVNTNGYVPPYQINELTILGFMVLSRQQILMVHDMVTYAESPEEEESVPVLRVPPETRQAIYSRYKNDRFSDAFSLSAIVDPLLIVTESQVTGIRNIAFPTVAWAAINNTNLIKGTLSEYFWRGEWAYPMDWDNLDATTQKRVKSTFLANGFFIRPITSGIRVKKWLAIDPVGEYLRIQQGNVSTMLVDIECTPKCNDRKQREFKTVPFDRQLFEDEDDEVKFELDGSESNERGWFKTLDLQRVYFNKFGGGVGIHKLKIVDESIDKETPKSPDNDNQQQHEQKEPQDETQKIEKSTTKNKAVRSAIQKMLLEKQTSTTGLELEVRKRIEDSKIIEGIPESDTNLKVKDGNGNSQRKTNLRIATQLFGNYVNKKYCKAGSILCRLQHLLGRIAPEGVGLGCALRDEFKLNGIKKDGVRMWQLATAMVLPYIPQLVSQGVINMFRMDKLMALSASVRYHGIARKRFNLKMLPSYDPKNDIFRLWILFMRSEGITITYKNCEMEEVNVTPNDDMVDDLTHELIELTENLKFPGTKQLMSVWKYERKEYPVFEPMSDAEMKAIKKILQSNCAICVD